MGFITSINLNFCIWFNWCGNLWLNWSGNINFDEGDNDSSKVKPGEELYGAGAGMGAPEPGGPGTPPVGVCSAPGMLGRLGRL